MDAELFHLSHDYVGDLAETVALVWPAKHGANREQRLCRDAQLTVDIGQGCRRHAEPTRAVEKLGWAPRNAEDSIVDTARSLIDMGVVKA